jgi:hypothetical protein
MKKLKEFLSEIGLRILFYLLIGLIIAGVGYFLIAYIYGIYKIGETMYNELHFGSVLFGVIITIVVRAFIDMTKD